VRGCQDKQLLTSGVTSMAETIRGLKEVVDSRATEKTDCVQLRTAALANADGLGPPDLCRLTKTTAAGSIIGWDSQEMHFFHYVVGLDVIDAAHVSQYIASLVKAQESEASRSILLRAQRWTIRGGVYCCYNAVHRCDVRVEVRIPGTPGVVAYAVDANGKRLDLQSSENNWAWEGARLSAMLRSLLPTPRAPAVIGMPLLCHEAAVDAFVELATKHFATGETLGPCPVSHYGTHTLSELFFCFLLKSRRLALAEKVAQALPSSSAHMARVLRKRGQGSLALERLSTELRGSSNDAVLLHCEAKMLLKSAGCEELALLAADLALQLSPTTWPYWITLARALAKAGKYAASLAALNAVACVARMESDPTSELGLPELSSLEQTVPREGLVQAGLVASRPAPFETFGAAEYGMDDFRGFGPEFGTLNPWLDDRQPLKTASEEALLEELATGAGARMHEASAEERKGYAVLVSIQKALGWESLLALRSEVFLVEDDDDDHVNDTSLPTLDRRAAESICGGAWEHPKGRRLCSWYFDSLFDALHSDLSLHTRLSKRMGLSRTSPDAQFGGSGDLWMHAGALAQRLQLEQEQELAFRLCQARTVCPAASLALLKCYTSGPGASVEPAVAQLSLLCQLVSLAGFGSDPSLCPSLLLGGWPDWIFEAGARVLSAFGMANCRDAVSRLPAACKDYHLALQDLLEDLSSAGVHGR